MYPYHKCASHASSFATIAQTTGAAGSSFIARSGRCWSFGSRLVSAAFVVMLGTPAQTQTLAAADRLPVPAPMPPLIEVPKDRPFAGRILLEVDATDVRRRIFQVHETIPVSSSTPLTLLFPQWTQGDHSPNGPLDKLAGLIITCHGQPVRWVRDTVQVYAFHVDVPRDATSLDVKFQYLGSTGSATGPVLINGRMFDLQWQSAVLYPAGYFSRDITFAPSLILPAGWNFFSSLDGASRQADTVTFTPVTLDTLVDSPVMAGLYARQVVMSTAPVLVNLDVVADDAAGLARG